MNKEQRDKMADEYALTVYKDLDSIEAKYMVKDFAAGHASRQSEIDELRRALEAVVNESQGLIKCHELAIRLDHGNSNYNVMCHWWDVATAILTKHKGGV